jgi:hypothetical protein
LRPLNSGDGFAPVVAGPGQCGGFSKPDAMLRGAFGNRGRVVDSLRLIFAPRNPLIVLRPRHIEKILNIARLAINRATKVKKRRAVLAFTSRITEFD